MKNKGFTLYELLISIVFLSLIMTALMTIIFNIRETQATSVISYEMNNYSAIILNEIQKDNISNQLLDVTSCGANCFEFDFSGVTKTLSVNTTNNIITYDTVDYSAPTNAKISTATYETFDLTVAAGCSTINKITIPISHNQMSEDYSLIYVHQVCN